MAASAQAESLLPGVKPPVPKASKDSKESKKILGFLY